MKLLEYPAADGRSPFADWFAALEANAAAKIVVSLNKLAQGNLAQVKSVAAAFWSKG